MGAVSANGAGPAAGGEPGTGGGPPAARGGPLAKLELRGLSKRYGGPDGELALDAVDVSVATGELVCIVGASGCGKSTLLKIVAGLEGHTGGQVLLDGAPVTGPGADRGLVFQAYSLFPWRTVADNVGFGLELAGVRKRERQRTVVDYLATMQLSRWADRLPAELSGGMRQRVAIARAMANDPEVLLLDEPFGALDAQTRRSMHDFLRSAWLRTGTTIVMVTHDVEEAIYLAERVYVFSSRPGRVAEEIEVPFGRDRGPLVRRDPRFLDLRDAIDDLLLGQVPTDDPQQDG